MDEVGVSQAQFQLHRLVDQAVEGEIFTITKNGRPCAVLLGFDEYHAMRAALDDSADWVDG